MGHSLQPVMSKIPAKDGNGKNNAFSDSYDKPTITCPSCNVLLFYILESILTGPQRSNGNERQQGT